MSVDNYCLCCGNRTEYYGTAWISTNDSGECSREVCALCLESGCPNCYGNKLSKPAGEYHRNCQHDKKED